ncbi:hypothetical protein AB1Y20_016259 [Prymnesium parvum]|uniref:CYTH domain-containing protein n=1 Tax=Prymnesium parvum TaxID=97485 RepID=A0AB34ICT0_PRYPA
MLSSLLLHEAASLLRLSRLRVRMSSAPPLIEVERKFEASLLAEDLEAAVVRLGGSLEGSVRFTDVYFDTEDCLLTRDDVWLRRRDEQWELKVPVEEEAHRSGGERTVFHETTRAKLRLGICAIDVDVASFGLSVVEIEVMCAHAAEVAAAEAEIERVAAAIGVAPLAKGRGGKLETYIRRFCPAVEAQLVEAGVLQPSDGGE